MKTFLGRRRNLPTGGLIQVNDFTHFLSILIGAINFYSVHNIQTGSRVQLASFSMNTGIMSRE